MTQHIKLPKQPVVPVCSRCVYCGGYTTKYRNGVKCVYCLIHNGWQIVPMRGSRSKKALPCTRFIQYGKLGEYVNEN